ncbi:ATP-binding protein [Pseudovibrio ascidiaceicola]|uniref:ATP-binding protein n=1 Tax=Pseudovibrio ascidiaceicola TaxID=285279 RepID=UPI000D68ED2D|nr:ATP-binding protein [Pseudovibrio ascidiaceicola]
MHKQAELEAVYGRRGSGKSTITKQRLKELPRGARVIAFDTVEEYEGAGWNRVRTMKALLKVIQQKWKTGFKISFVPTADEEVEELDQIARIVWECQKNEGKNGTHFLIVVEEADLSIPNQKKKAGFNAVKNLILRGRHRAIDMIAITQRPALLEKTYRANCAREFVFTLADESDRQAIAKVIGRTKLDDLRRMPKFSFLLLEDGSVKTGKTDKKGGYSYR